MKMRWEWFGSVPVAVIPQTRFTAKGDCQRRADDLNAFELTMHQMRGTGGEAHNAYSCQPCTVEKLAGYPK
jgi:hypothetical protein